MSKAAPWAYSRINKFKTCPKQYYHTLIAKDYAEEFSGEKQMYGNAVHTAAQEFIDWGKPVPKKFEFMVPVLESLKAKTGEKLCELKLGITEDLKPCEFFDDNVWFRTIIDLLIVDGDVAYVIDYKAGSNKYVDKGQLELMALVVFIHYPEVTAVRSGLLFVVHDNAVRETFSRSDQTWMWNKWMQEYSKLEEAHDLDVWNPTQNGLCKRHCVVTECVYNGKNA
ncbi:MAG TPA: PD-(D/E)XK nuclease family protein [Candidatus Paceibacterota bacterium]|nr:PD-(D/E)XK nuclease family protein [Candidatus Paceibacterota bacterium]